MTTYTNTIVDSQVPEFIRTDYPKFIEFLRAYYEFVDNYTVNFEKLRDVDLISDELILFLKQEFSSKFPQSQIDDRKLIKVLRQVYNSKGTINAIELLFHIFYDEVITVYSPNESILRPSDGQWSQLYSIRAERTFGSVPNDFSTITITNGKGIFNIEVDTYEVIDIDTTVFFFNTRNRIEIEPDAINFIDIKDNNGVVVYRGSLITHGSKISITNGGQYWKRGQVIRFPGTTEDTIIRITRVNSAGSIESLEIVSKGGEHTPDQLLVISPFPTAPAAGNITLDTTVVGVLGDGTLVYNFELGLTDVVTDIYESFLLIRSFFGDDSYFFSYTPSSNNYTNEDYFGLVDVEQITSTTSAPVTSNLVDPSLTYEQWLASRAYLSFSYDYIYKDKGEYLNANSQLSNSSIRLQDGYFYQLFSYVISTSTDISTYRNIMSNIHQAGYKMFGELNRLSYVLVSPSVQAIQPNPHSYQTDTVEVTDSITFEINI